MENLDEYKYQLLIYRLPFGKPLEQSITFFNCLELAEWTFRILHEEMEFSPNYKAFSLSLGQYGQREPIRIEVRNFKFIAALIEIDYELN